LSVDLVKGVYFCFSENRGGGAIDFLIRYEKAVNCKTITRDQARREIRRTFNVPDAKTVAREASRREVSLFVEYALPRFADWAKAVERALREVKPEDFGTQDEMWDFLAIAHKELWWSDEAFQACVASSRKLVRDIFRVFNECKKRKWWTPEIEVYAQHLQDMRRRSEKLGSEQRRLRDERCQESRSEETTIRKRTPILRKMPVVAV
jgi:hypothetical protein